MIEALDIQVTGIVQGVGFRPFVYRTARKYLINGWVLNATDGVFIHAEGEGKLLDGFVLELSENPPAASRVEEVSLKEVPLEGSTGFEIRFSDDAAAKKTTLVSPDLATCDDCVRELFDPSDRRFHYPFINCTNCGPRFTIIERLPYDRKSTSMKEFPMCSDCASEYRDPLDRRFHAQPDACFECGPRISWRERMGLADELGLEALGSPLLEAGEAGAADSAGEAAAAGAGRVGGAGGAVESGCDAAEGGDGGGGAAEGGLTPVIWGGTRERSDAAFARAAEVLCAGGIVAVKGLGGFHLACDANNPQAVAKLRRRKRREGKAFAVMMRSMDDVRRVCEASPAEEALLTGAQRPIVLLRKRPGVRFSADLADRLPELGVMLPYTPVQHLLLAAVADAGGLRAGELPLMVVMTSGNIHDEPIVTDDDEAARRLLGVADAFLGNDRAICTRYDDSVVRVVRIGAGDAPAAAAAPLEATQFVRRARGFAPQPLEFSAGPSVPGIFAAGPEQKNTFAVTRAGEAFVSQHVGDMENAQTYDAWLAAKARFEALFELRPGLLACDLHPEYLSTKWAQRESRASGLPLVEVQHHHAHIAAVLGEHRLEGPVCGIAFDGTGYGTDEAIWGGEVLLANQRAFERFANFAYVSMPGGAAAVKNPLRMAYGVLWAFDLLDHPGAQDALAALGPQAQLCGQMIERGLNTPHTSSVGRLFDAAAALLGICREPLYEGEPAILLEASIQPDPSASGGFSDVAAACGAPSYDPAADRYVIDIVKNTATANSTAQDTSVVLLDAAPLFRALLDDAASGVPTHIVARRFHDAFVRVVVQAAELVRAVYGIDVVALGGGVFMNRYLLEHALAALQDAGFTVAINRDLPPNDGCISYGQAVVACAQFEEQQGE